MQNQTLPIQLSPTAVAPPPAKAGPPSASDSPAFSQSLSREIAQRQTAAAAKAAPASAPSKLAAAAATATPTSALAPAEPAAGPVRAPGHVANVDNTETPAVDAIPEESTAAAAPADDAEVFIIKVDPDTAAAAATAAAATEGAAVAAPMADMLAMVASYQKLLEGGAPAAKPAATAITDDTAKAVSGASLATDTHTLAVLQKDLKKSDDAVPGKKAELATAQADPDGTPAAKPRTAPDVAPAATRAAPQSETALATLREAATTATVKDTAPVTGSAFQAQLTSAEMVQTAVTPASDTIPARLGTTAWDNQVSQKVVWMVGGLDQTASLTLNPPDLGPVQVVLNVNNDQATVAFSSATPEVREALENAMPRLREMMSDAGVTLGEASVSADMPDQRQADTSQGNGNRNHGNNAGNGGGVRRGETDVPIPRAATRAVRADGAVDTFA